MEEERRASAAKAPPSDTGRKGRLGSPRLACSVTDLYRAPTCTMDSASDITCTVRRPDGR